MSKVYWIMGLSGSGKSTVGLEIARIFPTGVWLDTDWVRKRLSPDLGWTEADRTENVRRLAAMADILVSQSRPVVVCCTTPLRAHRQLVHDMLGGDVRIIYLNCPLSVCKVRSTEAYYDRVGKDPQVTSLAGVDFPFQVPHSDEPVEVFDSCNLSAESIAFEILTSCPSLTTK